MKTHHILLGVLSIVAFVACVTIDVAPSKDVYVSFARGPCAIYNACYTWANRDDLLWSTIGPSEETTLIGFPLTQISSIDVASITNAQFIVFKAAIEGTITGGNVATINSSASWSEENPSKSEPAPSAGIQVATLTATDNSQDLIIDVTDALKELKQNGEFGLRIAGNSGRIKSKEGLPGGYVLRITYSSNAPSTSAPSSTGAPTTSAAPTTSLAPSTSAPSTTTAAPTTTSQPTSKSCSSANVSGPNVASPARGLKTVICSGNGSCDGYICKCNEGYSGIECENEPTSTTSAPSTSTPGENTNISGNNNARAANSATKFTVAGSLLFVLIFALFC